MRLPRLMSAIVKLALAILVIAAVVAFLDSSAPAQVVTGAAPTRAASATPGRTAQPTPASFAISVTDAELTRSAAADFPQTVNGVTVTDPQVRIESDRVRLTARARILFGTADFVMIAVPSVANGRLDVRVDSATLAGFSIPSDTRASIQQTVQATIARYVPATVNVTSVTLVPGTLTVRGTQR